VGSRRREDQGKKLKGGKKGTERPSKEIGKKDIGLGGGDSSKDTRFKSSARTFGEEEGEEKKGGKKKTL